MNLNTLNPDCPEYAITDEDIQKNLDMHFRGSPEDPSLDLIIEKHIRSLAYYHQKLVQHDELCAAQRWLDSQNPPANVMRGFKQLGQLQFEDGAYRKNINKWYEINRISLERLSNTPH